MATQPERPVDGKMLHVWMRGTRKLPIVTDEEDKWLILDSMYRMNQRAPARRKTGSLFVPGRRSRNDPADTLVDIVSFCVLDNHLHLQLLAKIGKDLSEFVRKLSISITSNWRKKTGSSGHLFESTFRRRVLKDDHQERVAFSYIQIKNAAEGAGLSLDKPTVDEMIDAAARYKFSSLPDYFLGRNLPIVAREKMLERFPSLGHLRAFVARHPRFATEPAWGGTQNGMPSRSGD